MNCEEFCIRTEEAKAARNEAYAKKASALAARGGLIVDHVDISDINIQCTIIEKDLMQGYTAFTAEGKYYVKIDIKATEHNVIGNLSVSEIFNGLGPTLDVLGIHVERMR